MLAAAMRVGVRDGAAALGEGETLTGVCAQERVTRIRGGPTPGGVPDQALDLLLQRAGRSRADLSRLDLVGGDGSIDRGRWSGSQRSPRTRKHRVLDLAVRGGGGRGVRSPPARRERLDRPRRAVSAEWTCPGTVRALPRRTPRFRSAMGFARRDRRPAVRGAGPASAGRARHRPRATGLARCEPRSSSRPRSSGRSRAGCRQALRLTTIAARRWRRRFRPASPISWSSS